MSLDQCGFTIGLPFNRHSWDANKDDSFKQTNQNPALVFTDFLSLAFAMVDLPRLARELGVQPVVKLNIETGYVALVLFGGQLGHRCLLGFEKKLAVVDPLVFY